MATDFFESHRSSIDTSALCTESRTARRGKSSLRVFHAPNSFHRVYSPRVQTYAFHATLSVTRLPQFLCSSVACCLCTHMACVHCGMWNTNFCGNNVCLQQLAEQYASPFSHVNAKNAYSMPVMGTNFYIAHECMNHRLAYGCLRLGFRMNNTLQHNGEKGAKNRVEN